MLICLSFCTVQLSAGICGSPVAFILSYHIDRPVVCDCVDLIIMDRALLKVRLRLLLLLSCHLNFEDIFCENNYKSHKSSCLSLMSR